MSEEGSSPDTPVEEVVEDLVQQMDSALTEYQHLLEGRSEPWEQSGTELSASWSRFRGQLEAVKADLLQLRATLYQVSDQIESANEVQSDSLAGVLEDTYRELLPWVKALLMMPSEATPKPPGERAKGEVA